MDICFKAFQGERIGKMVEDAVSVPAKPQLSRVLPVFVTECAATSELSPERR